MSNKDLSLSTGRRLLQAERTPKSVELLRDLFIKILAHASEGHFVLREKGRIIAEAGDKYSALRAEADVVDTRVYARALLGGNTAAGEAYVDGWWTSPDITQVTRFFARNLSMMDYWGSRFGWLFKPLAMVRLLSRANHVKQMMRNVKAMMRSPQLPTLFHRSKS